MKTMKMMLSIFGLLISTQVSALIVNHGKDKQWPSQVRIIGGSLRCSDGATGAGFIMYTSQDVNARFNVQSNNQGLREHSAKNFLCVRYSNASWQFDGRFKSQSNLGTDEMWHPFEPAATDVLVASVDYSLDTVADLKGSNLKYGKLQIGYANGDMRFTPNQNDQGISVTGTFRVQGSFLTTWAGTTAVGVTGVPAIPVTTTTPPPVTDAGAVALGVVTGSCPCTDANTGNGYIMYSATDINKRWNKDSSGVDFANHTAANFVCVRYLSEQWEYDTNWQDEPTRDRSKRTSWHGFIPLPTDILIATVDFANDNVMDLKRQNFRYQGIQTGYAAGDISIFPNQDLRGNLDQGEFRLAGNWLHAWGPYPAASPAFAYTTVTTTLLALQATTIRLPAMIGARFKCSDSSGGNGFIMYTPTPLSVRFGASCPGHLSAIANAAQNFACIRFSLNKWQYECSSGKAVYSWIDFVPTKGDLAVASFDYGTKLLKPMVGVNVKYNGMQLGYAYGDLVFSNYAQDIFGVRGTYIAAFTATSAALPPWTLTGPQPTAPVVTPAWLGASASPLTPAAPKTSLGAAALRVAAGSFSCGDRSSGTGYVMFTKQPVNLRFPQDTSPLNFMKHGASNLVCVRLSPQRTSWQYDANWGNWANQAIWRNFVPLPTDAAVYSIAYQTGAVEDLKTKSTNYNGLQVGYLSGDISLKPQMDASKGVTIGGSTWFADADAKKKAATSPNWLTASGSYIVPAPTTLRVPVLPPKTLTVTTGDLVCGSLKSKGGYVLYSQKPVNYRFGSDTSPQNFMLHSATNFMCVRTTAEGRWQYDANWGDWAKQTIWRDFKPETTDVLVIKNSPPELLKQKKSAVNGITAGFLYGDLQLVPNHLYSVVSMTGTQRIKLTGTYIIPYPHVNAAVYKGPAPAGSIAAKTGEFTCGDEKSGKGMIIFSHVPVNARFGADTAQTNFAKHAATNFFCIRYIEKRWKYDANWGNWAKQPVWKDFVPRPDDAAVASLMFATGETKDMRGVSKEFAGLKLGYLFGDLSYSKGPSAYTRTGSPTLTMTVKGSYVMFQPYQTAPSPIIKHPALPVTQVVTGDLFCGNGKSGHGVIMYSAQPVNVRFSTDTSQINFQKHFAKNLVCTRFFKTQWQYDANWGNWASKPIWRAFVPLSTDVGVGLIDYRKKVETLQGINKRYQNMQLGYLYGDLTFTPTSPLNSVASYVEGRASSMAARGSYIISHPLLATQPQTVAWNPLIVPKPVYVR